MYHFFLVTVFWRLGENANATSCLTVAFTSQAAREDALEQTRAQWPAFADWEWGADAVEIPTARVQELLGILERNNRRLAR